MNKIQGEHLSLQDFMAMYLDILDLPSELRNEYLSVKGSTNRSVLYENLFPFAWAKYDRIMMEVFKERIKENEKVIS